MSRRHAPRLIVSSVGTVASAPADMVLRARVGVNWCSMHFNPVGGSPASANRVCDKERLAEENANKHRAFRGPRRNKHSPVTVKSAGGAFRKNVFHTSRAKGDWPHHNRAADEDGLNERRLAFVCRAAIGLCGRLDAWLRAEKLHFATAATLAQSKI